MWLQKGAGFYSNFKLHLIIFHTVDTLLSSFHLKHQALLQNLSDDLSDQMLWYRINSAILSPRAVQPNIVII